MKLIKIAVITAVFCLMSGVAAAQSQVPPQITNTGGANTVSGTQSGNNDSIQTNSGVIVGGMNTGGTPSGTPGNITLGGAQSVNIQTPRNTASAFAPTLFPTVTCFKGISGAGQGPMFGFSFGGGKIDHNCAALEVARSFAEVGDSIAYCKVMLTNKYVKQAGVTMGDCLDIYRAPAAIVEAPRTPSLTVNVPATQVTVQPAPVVVEQKACPVAKVVKKRHYFFKKPVVLPCGQVSKKK